MAIAGEGMATVGVGTMVVATVRKIEGAMNNLDC